MEISYSEYLFSIALILASLTGLLVFTVFSFIKDDGSLDELSHFISTIKDGRGLFLVLSILFIVSIGIVFVLAFDRVIDGETIKHEDQYRAKKSALYVIDGDTIKDGNKRMRLLEIDAPETYKPRCDAEKRKGKEATETLRRWVKDAKKVSVIHSGKVDKYDRDLIYLRLDGLDAGRELIKKGLAVKWEPGSKAWQFRRDHWCNKTKVK